MCLGTFANLIISTFKKVKYGNHENGNYYQHRKIIMILYAFSKIEFRVAVIRTS